MSPVGAIFVPFPPKTGTNVLHPLSPQSLNLSIPYSQWRRRYDNGTRVSSIRLKMASRIKLGQAFGLKKGESVFFKPASLIEPSRGINQTSNAGKLEALATGTNRFSCSERRLFHLLSIGGERDVKNKGRKPVNPTCPVETADTSILPDDQRVTTSPPRTVKEEGVVTLNDADIPDSIARALFDALQENRTGNQLPAMRISGGSRMGLLTTAVNWPRYQNSPVSHTLEGISNPPSTDVPAQINSRRSGLIPATEAEANVQADPIHGNRPYYDVIVIIVGELEKVKTADFYFF